jgi:hypothetical protein
VVAVTGHITVAGVVNVAEIVAWNLGHLRFSDIINSSSALSKLDRTTALSLTPLSVDPSLEQRGLIYQSLHLIKTKIYQLSIMSKPVSPLHTTM